MKTYTQAELDAAIVETVRKCAEHRYVSMDDRICACGFKPTYKGDRMIQWACHIRSAMLPADILASVERDRQRLQLEARLAEANWWYKYDGCADGFATRIAALEAELKKLPES